MIALEGRSYRNNRLLGIAEKTVVVSNLFNLFLVVILYV